MEWVGYYLLLTVELSVCVIAVTMIYRATRPMGGSDDDA